MRTVCFVITSHIHYSRSRKLIDALRSHPKIKLKTAVAASALLDQYGDVLGTMAKDGIPVDAKIVMTLAGGSPIAMAKTTGIGITEFATVFENMRPDIVLIRGDRYEVLAAAVAAAYMNIPVAHIEGGDVTGSIDESVRHAVTKLAHIHFPTNDESRKRIIAMGEDPAYVFNVGSPELEGLEELIHPISSDDVNKVGVGATVDMQKPYLVVLHHPVTSEVGVNRAHTEALLNAIHALGTQAIWFWPNVDAGTDEVSKAIRVFREHHTDYKMRFLKYVTGTMFLGLLSNCACLVGNSSAGIKEAGYLGVPSVNVGTRQQGRMRGENVTDVSDGDEKLLRSDIEKQMKHGRYPKSTIYYKENCASHIADKLSSVNLYTQKRFHG